MPVHSARSRSHLRQRFNVATRQTPGASWVIRTDVLDQELNHILTEPDQYLQNPELFLKSSKNVTVARIPASFPGRPGYVLRRANYGRWRHRLKDCFRISRARRAFWTGLVLEEAGLNVVQTLAAGEVRTLRWPRRAYLLMAEVPGASSLARWLTSAGQRTGPLEKDLSRTIAALHEAGFTHGDLKSSNILVDVDERPVLIDLDGVQHHAQVDVKSAADDLGRLAAGLIEAGAPCRLPAAARFLKHYAKLRRMDDWRRIYEASWERAQRKLSRQK